MIMPHLALIHDHAGPDTLVKGVVPGVDVDVIDGLGATDRHDLDSVADNFSLGVPLRMDALLRHDRGRGTSPADHRGRPPRELSTLERRNAAAAGGHAAGGHCGRGGCGCNRGITHYPLVKAQGKT